MGWLNLRLAIEELDETLYNYIHDEMDPSTMETAKRGFSSLVEMPQVVYDDDQLLDPWTFYLWKKEGRSIAEHALAHRPDAFDSFQRDIIHAAIRSPLRFYLVERVIYERRVILRDIFRQQTIISKEKMGTHSLRRGLVLFGNHLTVGDQTVQLSFGMRIIPNHFFGRILKMGSRLLMDEGCETWTEPLLEKYGEELRSEYLRIVHEVERPFQLTNQDGEDLVPQTLSYRLICDERTAYEKLRSLCPQEFETEPDPEEEELVISWLCKKSDEPLDNVSLGQLTIRDHQLEIFVNSTERGERIQEEIKKRLGDHAIFLGAHESAFEDEPQEEEDTDSDSEESQETVPALQDIMMEVMQRHWEKWPDTPLPMLDGETPHEAAGTADGREILDAFLMDAEERNNEFTKTGMPFMVADVDKLRNELGLQFHLLENH